MPNLNPWKKKELKLTYGELEGAHTAVQDLLEGAYKVGANPLARTLNKARAHVQIGSLERAMQNNPLDLDTAGLVVVVRANPAVTRFYRDTISAAIEHYVTVTPPDRESAGHEHHEQINVLKGLQAALTKPD